MITRKFLELSFVVVVVCEIRTSEVRRPRGVSLARVSLYAPGNDFICLDGSLTIPYTQVNDDYCDCPDGSDEPGTAACPQGSFYCTNAGHKPLTIPSSRVNDGICDCCDASDEYATKNSNCINNCHELERSARIEAQKRAELYKLGSQIRAEMSQKGLALKQENKDKLAALTRNKNEAEHLRSEKEAIKKEAEDLENAALEYYRKLEEEERKRREEEEALIKRNEAMETFTRFDSNQDGKIDLSELQTRNSFDRDQNGEVSEEEAKFYLDEQIELEFEDFLNRAWPKIKPILMLDSGLFKPPKPEQEQQQEEEKVDEIEPETEQEPELEDSDEENEDAEELDEDEEEQTEPETEHEPERVKEEMIYDEETQKLVDRANEVRSAYHEADRAFRNIESDIKNLEETLEKDYGRDEEFAVLSNQCFEYTDREYIYKLCPFDNVVQKPKSGASETRLGKWGEWAGPEGDKYQVMLYDHGQSCWNGPTRSTRVRILCGSDNSVTNVAEPNRCEYSMDFTTPAACHPSVLERTEQDDTHDEL